MTKREAKEAERQKGVLGFWPGIIILRNNIIEISKLPIRRQDFRLKGKFCGVSKFLS